MRLTNSILFACSLLGVAIASNVIDLDTKNFESIVGGSKPALVEFFAPWCGHCKNLAPTYEQLADAFPSDKVVIAKTDADGVGKELGKRFGVTGYPTLKWFPAGSMEPQDYTGGRDLDSLAGFVAQESGTKSKIKPPPPPAAVQLDASNFAKIALDEKKDVLVAFTAPWCGHCKNMKPAYESVARAFASEPSVVVAQMNADDEQNKPIAGQYDVHSFPTIKFFPKGAKEPVQYNSGRTEEQFIDFLNENAGTFRTPGGSLSVRAGKVLTLDTLAENFFIADLPAKPEILKEAQAYLSGLGSDITSSVNSSADYYIKAMQRILDKGEGWLTKEQARIAGLLQSPSLAPTKLDELRIKANILSSFAEKKVEELADAAGDALEDGAEGVKAFVDMMEEQGAKATQRIKEEL